MMKMGPVVSTSRSGNVGPATPLQALEALEQNATHITVQCDANSATQIYDMWNYFNKPVQQLKKQEMHVEELIDLIRSRMHKMPENTLKSSLALMLQVRVRYSQSLAELRIKMERPTTVPISQTLLQEVQLDLEETAITVSEIIADITEKLSLTADDATIAEVEAKVAELNDTVSQIANTNIPGTKAVSDGSTLE